MKTPEQLEADYQLGKDLQKIGYIKTSWKVDPKRLAGEKILKEMKERNDSKY